MLRSSGLLTPLQRAFIAGFAMLPDQTQFCLAGGTALAEYYCGHRLSYDHGFFTGEADLVLPYSYSYLIEKLGRRGEFDIRVTRRFATYVEFLATQGNDTLKVDLALDSPFQREPPARAEVGVMVRSLADLCTDKLLTYYGRAEPRDAADLYFILQRTPLDELLSQAARKDPGFDLHWFAVALQRVADFPDQPERWPLLMLMPFDPQELKARFQALALRLMENITSANR